MVNELVVNKMNKGLILFGIEEMINKNMNLISDNLYKIEDMEDNIDMLGDVLECEWEIEKVNKYNVSLWELKERVSKIDDDDVVYIVLNGVFSSLISELSEICEEFLESINWLDK